jgi:hypothetical protein
MYMFPYMYMYFVLTVDDGVRLLAGYIIASHDDVEAAKAVLANHAVDDLHNSESDRQTSHLRQTRQLISDKQTTMSDRLDYPRLQTFLRQRTAESVGYVQVRMGR